MTSGTDAKVANYSFSALIMSALAGSLLLLYAINTHAGVKAYLVAAAYTVPLSAAAARRCQMHFPKPSATGTAGLRHRIDPLISRWSLVFFMVGFALCWVALLGSAGVMAIFAGLFSLIPWSRTGLVRSSYPAAFLAVMLGMLVAIGTRDIPAWPIGLILSAVAASLVGGTLLGVATAQALVTKPKPDFSV